MSFWDHSVHLFQICLTQGCTSKEVAGRKVKRTEIWDLIVVVICKWGTFDLLVFNVILGHTVHFSQNGLYLEND